jgi:2-C-methyl-D-erythritol 4-phosphate cytidylyltransferase / 2-C-methyl-D-erythritol 2,4-cyclodiphosphate synthase
MPNTFNTAALIVAAGSGSRVGGDVPKQFRLVNGIPMIRHCYQSLALHGDIGQVYVVIGEGQNELAASCLEGLPDPVFITGGATRRESVYNGLEHIQSSSDTHRVLIHDAARPFLSAAIIDMLLGALNDSDGAVPALPVVDSLARGTKLMTETVDRQDLWRIQTPQAFVFEAIWQAHKNWNSAHEATDDARMLLALGGDVALVAGDEALSKFTFADDFNSGNGQNMVTTRIGTGFDVHRLVAGEELWLCGIKIEHTHGLSGHSDADVALHAVTDAILGAMAMGDIGDHFPPSDPKWRGASSDQFAAHAIKLAADKGYSVGNLDLTIICEAPKIGPYRKAMRMRLSEILQADVANISVKATTTEMLGFTGRGEGIAAQAAVTMKN